MTPMLVGVLKPLRTEKKKDALKGGWPVSDFVFAQKGKIISSEGIRHALEELPNLEIVQEVGNGPELFAALEQMQPECLLIDITMPDFEPVIAIRQIREHYPAMKILVISAYDDDKYVYFDYY